MAAGGAREEAEERAGGGGGGSRRPRAGLTAGRPEGGALGGEAGGRPVRRGEAMGPRPGEGSMAGGSGSAQLLLRPPSPRGCRPGDRGGEGQGGTGRRPGCCPARSPRPGPAEGAAPHLAPGGDALGAGRWAAPGRALDAGDRARGAGGMRGLGPGSEWWAECPEADGVAVHGALWRPV